MASCGKVEITLSHKDGKIYNGISFLGRTKKFDYTQINHIQEVIVSKTNGNPDFAIKLSGKNFKFVFGKYLSTEKRAFILSTIQKTLLDGNKVKDILEPNLFEHLITQE